HLRLARSQRLVAPVQLIGLDPLGPGTSLLPQRTGDRAQQGPLLDRFREEVVRTRLDCAHTRRDVAVAGEKDHGYPPSRALQLGEELEPVQVGQTYVEDQASADGIAQRREKLLRRAERMHGDS